jgi:hypothetical protein
MPTIEDIDYLKKNSIKQDYVFLVDSKERDKQTYSTPSEYVVEFSPPFQNVIGLSVLEATIPRTMYNIDVYNNTISYFVHSSNYDLNNLPITSFNKATLETGDYTIQSLIVEINSKLEMHLNNDSNLPLVKIASSPLSNPSDIKNKIVFSCAYPFILNMHDSSAAESLGFDAHIRVSEYSKNIFNRDYTPYRFDVYPGINQETKSIYYDLIKSNTSLSSNTSLVNNVRGYINNHQLFHSVDIPFSQMLSNETLITENTYTLFEGPRGVLRKENLSEPIAQRIYIPYETNMVRVYAALYTDFLSASNIASFTVQEDVDGIPSGISLANESIAVSHIDGSLSDSTPLELPLKEDTYYWIVFNANPLIDVYYNDTLATATTFKLFRNNTWINYDDTINDIYYQLSVRIDVCDSYHKVIAPGIYSLIGERYIILRCPEIEENSFRSLAYTKQSIGIAKFRLGVVGFQEERFDYFNVPNREFHPIGRLSRLKLRFETAHGNLYDFKDVNHTITFGIQYLEPINKSQFHQSIINANYNGNFLDYQYTQQQQEEDSDDQDMDYNRDAFEKYKLNESRNLPFQVAQRNIQMYYDLNYEASDDESD